jgi:hypothetical protein
MTTTTVPLPAGAVEADDWEINPDGSVTRIFRRAGCGWSTSVR